MRCPSVYFVSMLVAVALTRPALLMAQGCAMCATLVGGPGDPLGVGINTSVLFLMAMPFVLTASVGAWMVYMYRRGSGEPEHVQPLQPRGEEAS